MLRCKLYDMEVYCGKDEVCSTVNTDQEGPKVRILLWRRNGLRYDDQEDASNDGDVGDDIDDGVSEGGGR